MINILFTKEIHDKAVIWAEAFYKETFPKGLPSFIDNVLERKPQEQVIEVFCADHRFFALRILEDSIKGREEAGAALYKKASEGIDKTLLFDCRFLDESCIDILCGIQLAHWKFDKYKTITKPEEQSSIVEIVVLCNEPDVFQHIYEQQVPFIEGVLLARTLTSEPPNIFYPTAYAESLKELEAIGIQVEILHEEQLLAIGMTAILAVGQGSAKASSVVVLTWKGINNHGEQPIVVVGKGVCFDSGGLCLKPTAHQHEMKWDKAGAGVVAGFLKTLALAKTNCFVIGIIGLVENMPDGAAVKPGDIIKTMSGQTVEIVNTDAEGRLVLADCLWYAQQKYAPKILIDLGTLTMETFASLGNVYAGLYSNDMPLAKNLKSAGESSGDLLWELPMGPFFAKQIESPVADMKNVGVDFLGENGAAAEFLKRFVKNVPWAHIDIAGVSWSKEDLPMSVKGVTGFGVRLLYDWIKKLSP